VNLEAFNEKNVFITGAGSGIGRATALKFAERGAGNVYLIDIREDRLERVAAEVESLGATPVPIKCDLLDMADCHRAVDMALAISSRLDIMVSNAAPPPMPAPFLDMPDSVWLKDINGILNASFVMGQRAARSMAKSGTGGSILYTISVNAAGAAPDFAAYCAAKGGQVALVKVMAVELAPFNIRVNGVSPGPTDTERGVEFLGEERMNILRQSYPAVPLGRLATPEDVANAFVYLASDAASYVTGINLIVDGGLSGQVLADMRVRSDENVRPTRQ
jgi:NAD(P)-dependent dehydrogenase (short-subunit alcohol dehydrogenase family)